MTDTENAVPLHPRLQGFLRAVDIKWEKVEDRSVFPWRLPFLRDFRELELHPGMNVFVGENGSGKSTLLEGIGEAVGINSEGGSRQHSFATTEHRSPLAACLRIVRGARREKTEFFLRAESFYNVTSNYESFGPPEPFRDLHSCSHGESFLRIVRERFGPQGLYLLDEPESALSPLNQTVLIQRMRDLIKQGSQFLIATHSPLLMAYPGAAVFAITPEGLRRIDFRETSHFRIAKRFADDPEGFLRELLE